MTCYKHFLNISNYLTISTSGMFNRSDQRNGNKLYLCLRLQSNKIGSLLSCLSSLKAGRVQRNLYFFVTRQLIVLPFWHLLFLKQTFCSYTIRSHLFGRIRIQYTNSFTVWQLITDHFSPIWPDKRMEMCLTPSNNQQEIVQFCVLFDSLKQSQNQINLNVN